MFSKTSGVVRVLIAAGLVVFFAPSQANTAGAEVPSVELVTVTVTDRVGPSTWNQLLTDGGYLCQNCYVGALGEPFFAYWNISNEECDDYQQLSWYCILCDGLEDCPTGEVENNNSYPLWFETRVEAEAYGWSQTNCGNCPGADADGLLSAALDRGAVFEIARLVVSSGGTVWLNEDREAIQGAGCRGTGVGVHLPIPAALSAQLKATVAFFADSQ